jgi:hypothetical protein
MTRTEDDLHEVFQEAASAHPASAPVLAQVRQGIIRRRIRLRVAAVSGTFVVLAAAVAVPAAVTRWGSAPSAVGYGPAESTSCPADRLRGLLCNPSVGPSASGAPDVGPSASGAPADETCTTITATRVPFRLGYVPAKTRAVRRCTAGTQTSVKFDRDGDPAYAEIRWSPRWTRPAGPPDLTVAGRPAWLGPSSTDIDLGGCILIVDGFVAGKDQNRRVAEGLTLAADCGDQSTWFDASTLPRA